MRANQLSTLLSDVKFENSRTDASSYTVKLHDHSRLGGPMGSESTFVIEKWRFVHLTTAKAFAKLLIERLAKDDTRIDAERDVANLFATFEQEGRDGYDSLVDLASVGVSIRRDASDHVIRDFTYERATVERVSAS